MAKKKKSAPQLLSPEKYIREKARSLPIGKCSIDKNWKDIGLTLIAVPRLHKQGTYTLATFMVDTFCRGVMNGIYYFNLPEEEYNEIMNQMNDRFDRQEIDYVEAHNIIYGAIAFAEEAGIKPDKSFELTRYILEEDTDDIPLIEYEFGKNGKHFLMAKDRMEASEYLPLLRKNLGDNFDYTIDVSDQEEKKEDNKLTDAATLALKDELLERMGKMFGEEAMPLTPYSYVHPDYPTTLELENEQLRSLFYDPKNETSLPEEEIAKVLSCPRESLLRDLEQIALFDTGCTCDKIPEERTHNNFYSPLIHVLFFLGELKEESSLDVVLETLRQNRAYMDYHFADSSNEVYIPTLYLLGQNRLQTLWEYIQEPGLYTFARYLIFPAVALIARKQPERRDEVVEWFRQVLLFYKEKIAENIYCDGTLVGMMMSDLMDINATELLPEIKALYDTGLVDKACCGDYQKVENEFRMGTTPIYREYAFDIYERYKLFKKHWG